MMQAPATSHMPVAPFCRFLPLELDQEGMLSGMTRGLYAQVTGQVTYNGETFDKFYPERTAAYVDQVCLTRLLCQLLVMLFFFSRLRSPLLC